VGNGYEPRGQHLLCSARPDALRSPA
jgi:hypothetical protein